MLRPGPGEAVLAAAPSAFPRPPAMYVFRRATSSSVKLASAEPFPVIPARVQISTNFLLSIWSSLARAYMRMGKTGLLFWDAVLKCCHDGRRRQSDRWEGPRRRRRGRSRRPGPPHAVGGSGGVVVLGAGKASRPRRSSLRFLSPPVSPAHFFAQFFLARPAASPSFSRRWRRCSAAAFSASSAFSSACSTISSPAPRSARPSP